MSAPKLEYSNGQFGIGRIAKELGKWSGEHICAKSANCSLHKISGNGVAKNLFVVAVSLSMMRQ